MEEIEKLGIGILHLFGGHTEAEKKEIMKERITNTIKNFDDKITSLKDASNKIDEGSTEEELKWRKKWKYNSYYDDIKVQGIDKYLNKLEEDKKKKKEEAKVVYVPKYYESAESIRIREQNQLEENNRLAASEELPKILDEIKTDFYSKIKEKVSIMKEKIKEEVNKYPLANIKEILQVLADNEKIKEKLIEDSKKETEIILNKSYDNSYHFNTLLIGQTGVGKSTLINGIFDFKENEGAKTGEGKPITENFDEYISNKRKCLRIIDSKGIEKGENNINKVFNSTKELIEKKAREGDPDKLIHCIWYCFKSSNLRFEDIEKNTLSLLMNQYDDNNLPIIIVITQNYDDKETEIMTKYITEEFKFLNRDITIIPVTAKEKIMEKKKNKFIIEKDGIEELLKISYEKSQKAIYPAILKSIKEKIIQTFIINTENKKNKLMDDLRETVEQLFNEVLENENLENNISKLSSVFEKTLNTFYEIPIISEKSQQDIADFLKNLSIWCVESLNDIILTLVKENSNELSRLLINEQTNVKNNHNVQKTLFNEKTIEQYTLDSENDLRPLITNEVYFLAVKEVYNLIAEKIVEIGEIVKKEEFDKIVPEFRNNISKEKLNQISNKILQNIVANN